MVVNIWPLPYQFFDQSLSLSVIFRTSRDDAKNPVAEGNFATMGEIQSDLHAKNSACLHPKTEPDCSCARNRFHQRCIAHLDERSTGERNHGLDELEA
jgi:hypothetical protein